MKALIPKKPDDLSGPYLTVDDKHFEVLAIKKKVAIIEITSRPKGIKWFDDYDLLLCQIQRDAETIKVIRKATQKDRRKYRIPLWLQGEEVPKCCGRPMFFVGQIDDDFICTEMPNDAKLWWHDAASFYVFTCSKCMECKAVGQEL